MCSFISSILHSILDIFYPILNILIYLSCCVSSSRFLPASFTSIIIIIFYILYKFPYPSFSSIQRILHLPHFIFRILRLLYYFPFPSFSLLSFISYILSSILGILHLYYFIFSILHLLWHSTSLPFQSISFLSFTLFQYPTHSDILQYLLFPSFHLLPLLSILPFHRVPSLPSFTASFTFSIANPLCHPLFILSIRFLSSLHLLYPI